jgi:hypothetical protein
MKKFEEQVSTIPTYIREPDGQAKMWVRASSQIAATARAGG